MVGETLWWLEGRRSLVLLVLLVLFVLPRVRLSNGLLGGAVLPVTTALRARSTRALPVGDMGMNVD